MRLRHTCGVWPEPRTMIPFQTNSTVGMCTLALIYIGSCAHLIKAVARAAGVKVLVGALCTVPCTAAQGNKRRGSGARGNQLQRAHTRA